MHKYIYNYLFRKLTDEIHKYETRLEKLEADMDEQETRRKSLEETLTKAQDVHEKNKRKFKLLQRSGFTQNIFTTKKIVSFFFVDSSTIKFDLRLSFAIIIFLSNF